VWDLTSCRRNQLPFSWNLRSYSMNSLGQTRQYLHLIFLADCLTWWNKFSLDDSLTVKECDQHHRFLLLEYRFFVSWQAWFCPLSFCLGIILKTPVHINYYSWIKQGTIVFHGSNKLMTSLQSGNLLFIGQTEISYWSVSAMSGVQMAVGHPLHSVSLRSSHRSWNLAYN
jgi:hypothetical protein